MGLDIKVKKLFEIYSKEVFKINKKVDLSKNRNIKFIDNFLDRLNKIYGLSSIGNSFLIDYFNFAFWYWADIETQRDIELSWILGPKSIERWLKKTELEYETVMGKFHKRFGFFENDIYGIFEEYESSIENIIKVHQQEEFYKGRMTNDAQQLIMCNTYTTLYNSNSDKCQSCNILDDCKELLKNKNWEVYEIRKNAAIKRGLFI
jgi:hypothetical protein